jgi:hypothetical protein
MRYQMGCVELVGWMILGGFLGGSVCGVVVAATGRPPDLGTAIGLFYLSIMLGAAVPVVVYCRGKWQ